jgi:ribonuclease T1
MKPTLRSTTVSRRRSGLVALCVLLVVVGGWLLLRVQSSTPSAPTPPGAETSTTEGATCRLATLPPEVVDTVRVIHSNGPFPFPRNDGVVFGNREGHLPDQARGYYHEYTVITPGASNRSTRRVITGGTPLVNPRQYFYTGNHYDSFCLISDVGRKP